MAYTVAFGIPAGSILAGIVAEASIEELRGFIATPQGRSLAYLLAGWTICYLTSAALAPSGPVFSRAGLLTRRIALLFLALATAYACTDPAQLVEGVALNPIVGGLKFLFVDIPKYKADLRLSAIHKIPYHAHRVGGEEIHILIIGESARRRSWSVYGYSRQTTPYLESLRDEAVFFQNATADANFTLRSVPLMLTGMSPEGFDIGKVRGNIFDLAREAGYASILLSNQDFSAAEAAGVDPDLIESPIDLYPGKIRRTVDGELLSAFRREMEKKGNARFIGIHMMGSHALYSNRYPENFSRFGSPDRLHLLSTSSVFFSTREADPVLLDAYDDSVVYTDWFLGQIIEPLRELPVPASVTFFADHGEALQFLDGESGHGQPVYLPAAFEVPAFVWANAAYRKLHPDVISALRQNAAKEIRSHNVFYTVAELMGIDWRENIAAESFASRRFIPDTKMKHIAGAAFVSRPADLKGH